MAFTARKYDGSRSGSRSRRTNSASTFLLKRYMHFRRNRKVLSFRFSKRFLRHQTRMAPPAGKPLASPSPASPNSLGIRFRFLLVLLQPESSEGLKLTLLATLLVLPNTLIVRSSCCTVYAGYAIHQTYWSGEGGGEDPGDAGAAQAGQVLEDGDALAQEAAGNVDRGMKTPTKVAPVPAPVAGPSVSEMSMDQIKAKLSRSAKLTEDFAEQAAEWVRQTQDDKDMMENIPFVSPSKMLRRTPTKANHSSLMSPQKSAVTLKRLATLMPPSKVTPVTTIPTKLLYKYRYLGELFKCIDTVCAMFHNRKKQITFRKLKPPVQRMARKNFYENRLAQNNTFNRLLLAKTKDAHETFLLALDLPMRIAKEKPTSWTPQMQLSLPPNLERFFSAKDVLSTGRNPFNFRIQHLFQPFVPHHFLLLICPINLEAHLPVQELQIFREQTGTNQREPYSGSPPIIGSPLTMFTRPADLDIPVRL
ncbi:DNA replication factor Cdt1 [Culex quinquefasciatus]|uniref:DNA replication factor Cdt1 n=1 Tax=Culex quinquefasciatus TaxID=7176 RepID=B0XGY9_CULQU|nr:DNA replication factor Cdt1 [Culex quinquefasciatus]|eukprot:XP_001868911.1 DNA replication factor Cdt1 [Culex quinquefasciatus]